MKVLLYFKQDEKKYYESARLWQSLSQACAFSMIDYTFDIREPFDIAHFVSMENEALIDQLINAKKPVVISVLSTESDYNAILQKKDGIFVVIPRAKRILNKVNLILAPSDMARIILKHSGIETPIQVVNDGVDTSRFLLNAPEMSLFSRYFSVKKQKPIVVSTGKYEEKAGIKEFYELAKNMPDVNFFWFGRTTLKTKRDIKKLVKNAPKNLWFEKIVDENVYVSTLLNATIYCVLGEKLVGTVTILDALASKTVVVAKDSTLLIDVASNNKITTICRNFKEIRAKIEEIILTKKTNDEKEVVRVLEQFSIDNFAKNLKIVYEHLLSVIS